jgi:hypothetical protein
MWTSSQVSGSSRPSSSGLVVGLEVLLALLPRSWIIAYCPNPVDPPYSVGDNTPRIIYIYVQYMYVYVCVCTVKAIYIASSTPPTTSVLLGNNSGFLFYFLELIKHIVLSSYIQASGWMCNTVGYIHGTSNYFFPFLTPLFNRAVELMLALSSDYLRLCMPYTNEEEIYFFGCVACYCYSGRVKRPTSKKNKIKKLDPFLWVGRLFHTPAAGALSMNYNCPFVKKVLYSPISFALEVGWCIYSTRSRRIIQMNTEKIWPYCTTFDWIVKSNQWRLWMMNRS